MNKIYNLTSYKGIDKAVRLFEKYGWIVNPLPWLVYKAFSPEVSSEKQIEAAIKLIDAAQKSGVKNLKIKIDHDAGIQLGTLLKGFPLNINIGNHGKIEMEINFDNLNPENQQILENVLKKFNQ